MDRCPGPTTLTHSGAVLARRQEAVVHGTGLALREQSSPWCTGALGCACDAVVTPAASTRNRLTLAAGSWFAPVPNRETGSPPELRPREHSFRSREVHRTCRRPQLRTLATRPDKQAAGTPDRRRPAVRRATNLQGYTRGFLSELAGETTARGHKYFRIETLQTLAARSPAVKHA
jgi:hypothetical protein